ncbi:MAG TPA: RNA degradosome polyphosphate kinase [Acidimicrobiales bacterium]|nr:RNA degradosome polyphosphate kinase [Acidimicrobiales bacterium]
MSSALRVSDDVAPPPQRYLNRELSWLDFNERVLQIAEDRSVALLERAKFLAIFSSNLDEFYQVRVAGLKDQVAAGVAKSGPDGLSPVGQLKEIRTRVLAHVERMSRTFLHEVVPGLAEVGIRLSDWDALDDDDREYLVDVFEARIFPVLTPLAVDPAHPFPHISDLSLNLAVIVRDPTTSERRFARVKVPPVLPRFVVMPDGERFVALEQVIAAHLDRLFPGMESECHFAFRVTRNADLTLDEDEADDLLAAVEIELRRRRRGRAVRLEVDAQMTDEVLELLLRELDLDPHDVFKIAGPLDLGGLWAVYDLERPELKEDPWTPVTQARLATDDDEPLDVFAVLREGEVLVHHPYESFATSVEAFVNRAAYDPDVLAIKQTLYRTSGDSPIVKSLIRAAERGKQVAALVEVTARFDEQRNIEWAKRLDDAGVHVTYGVVGLKTHSKIALVVRQEPDGIRRYCHVGTGNYNPKTARLYEDIGILTTDPLLGADLTDLFNFLTGYSRQRDYRKILVAPMGLREELIAMIQKEADHGAAGRIILKMNGLDDRKVIDALYEASQAGVSIDIVARAMCCLRPGVPGLSENIRVRSIVGRFLEHSRIFFFGGGNDGEGAYYVGSADMRARNLDRRVEVVMPVDDPSSRARLREILDVTLADQSTSWELNADGTWTRLTGEGRATHDVLRELATARARPWSSEPEKL